jgi:pimeloyl-ACP methyl ester carboxylesterase
MKNIFISLNVLILPFCFYSCNNNDSKTITETQTTSSPVVNVIFINGDSIHYIDIGQGDPVVLVHGTLGDYRSWTEQIDTFARNHRVIAYSRRYAYPNKQVINDSADYTVTPHAKDLSELIKALNLAPVHLIGHSYGAFTALLTAMEHPEQVRSLTLGEPPVTSLLRNVHGGDTIMNNFYTRTIIPAAGAFESNDNQKAVSFFINGVMDDSLVFSKIPPEVVENMMNNTLELRGYVITKNFGPVINCEDLKKVKAPVLLLKGDKSQSFFTSVVDELNRCIESKELDTLSNASHGLQFDNPTDFNKIVLGFINRH